LARKDPTPYAPREITAPRINNDIKSFLLIFLTPFASP